MADEIKVNCSLQVKKGNLDYQSRPNQFTADMDGDKGPSPGAVTISIEGTDIDLSEIETPGFARIQNLDQTNYVMWGIRDTSDGDARLPFELLPGEMAIVRLSRTFGESQVGTSTGTTADTDLVLHFMADTAECDVLIEVFDK